MNIRINWFGFQADSDNIPMPRPGVYLITNTVTGKPYVGISQNVRARLASHAKGGSPKRLGNSIRKHGLAVFLVQPIFYSINDDTTELPIVEAFLIEDYDSVRNGYNVIESGGGVGPYGPLFANILRASANSPEGQATWQRLWADPVYREKQRNGLINALADPVIKANMRQVTLELWQTAQYRNNRAAAFARPDVAEKRLAIFQSDEFRAKISATSIASWADPVYAEKTSKSIKAVWSNPDLRAAQSARFSVYLATDAGKAQRSTSAKIVMARPGIREKLRGIMRGLVWITDGTRGQRVEKGTAIPEGWRLGRQPSSSKSTKPSRRGSYTWITDGTTSQCIERSGAVPDGWRKGRVMGKRRTPRFVWITDGIDTRQAERGSPLPEGWRFGRTRRTRKSEPPVA